MVRDLGFYVGSFSTAGVGVFQMKNFDILTISFWGTLVGLLFFSFFFGVCGAAFFDNIKHKIKQWHGTGQTLSKGL